MNFIDKDGTTKVYIPVHPWKPRRIFSRGFPTPSLPVCTILKIENLELKTLDQVFSKVHTNNDFVD